MMKAFHKAFNHPIGGDEGLSLKNIALRTVLIEEEFRELGDELWNISLQGKISPNLLKEGADLLYVILGTFVSLGLGDELVEAFKRVHESNMSKLDENGKPLYREDGKVMKGLNYKPPNLEDLI